MIRSAIIPHHFLTGFNVSLGSSRILRENCVLYLRSWGYNSSLPNFKMMKIYLCNLKVYERLSTNTRFVCDYKSVSILTRTTDGTANGNVQPRMQTYCKHSPFYIQTNEVNLSHQDPGWKIPSSTELISDMYLQQLKQLSSIISDVHRQLNIGMVSAKAA